MIVCARDKNEMVARALKSPARCELAAVCGSKTHPEATAIASVYYRHISRQRSLITLWWSMNNVIANVLNCKGAWGCQAHVTWTFIRPEQNNKQMRDESQRVYVLYSLSRPAAPWAIHLSRVS